MACLVVAYVSQVFSPIITFAVFAAIAKHSGGGEVLDINRVFTSLSLFALLAEPLQALIMSLVTFLGSVGCFVRIQEFLDKPARVDTRRTPPELGNNSSTDQTLAFSEKGSVITEKTHASSTPTVESRLSFPFKDIFRRVPKHDAVIMQDVCSGWDTEKDPLLQSITTAIPRNKMTMVVGPVGCGKSIFLKAILGEVPCIGGTVELASLNIAYCDQTPWHMNESIKDTITGNSDLDEQWYTSVLRLCALEEDIRQLPRGDQTVVGSKGIALSGGQSQRIVCSDF